MLRQGYDRAGAPVPWEEREAQAAVAGIKKPRPWGATEGFSQEAF